MQLVFFLGNDLIEAVLLDPEKISVPGYLGKFKRCMKDKYQSLILKDGHLPEFLVVPFAAGNQQNAYAAAA